MRARARVSSVISAIEIAAAVRSSARSAVAVVRDTLERIEREGAATNAFTRLLPDRALAAAAGVDAAITAGRDPGSLAGVPFAAKDLFDIAGLPTTAGSVIRADAPPVTSDAAAVAAITAAGAILVGTTLMDEFAYGFVTDNAHAGRAYNPYDRDRLAGGSSGGSAAAVAAGLVPIALGSDTNGSVRIPASLCGLYGLRPTQGGAPDRAGAFPFVASFDTVGPFTRSVADMRTAYTALGGVKCDVGNVRVGRLTGWFEQDVCDEALAGVAAIVAALGSGAAIELPEAERCRAAAFVISACEGGNLHLPTLRTRAMDYDPAVRDRLLAGAMLPATAYLQAQRFRHWAREAARGLFDRVDLLVAPCTGVVAPRADEATIMVGGKAVPARANLGLYTQPLTSLGWPVLAVPLKRPGLLPLGVQLIAAPGRDGMLLDVAARLEADGVTGYSPPA